MSALNTLQPPQTPQSSQPPESPCKGWHSRGYLPHFDGGEIPQFITLRLRGSMPAALLDEWRELLDDVPNEFADVELCRRVEKYLDQGKDCLWLNEPGVAEAVENSLLYFDGERYQLHAWVVMPNHVHALLTPMPDFEITGIIHSFKSFTAKEANRLLGRTGGFWQADYYDRFMRNEAHYYRNVEYIEMNPVKAGLCANREEWRFGSGGKR